jgi:hypothetical protein
MVDLGLSLGLSAMSLDLEGTAAEPGWDLLRAEEFKARLGKKWQEMRG